MLEHKTSEQRLNGDGTPHVCEFDADGRCQMHPFTREVPTSKQNSFCDERTRVLADLRAISAREYRWLLSNPDNEDGRGFLGTLAWAIQHLDGLPEHWVAVDAPTRKPSDCLHEHASIICTDCGIDFRNARIRQDETTAPLSEADEVQIGRSQAELAVLKKDGRSYEIRRIAGQALEVITRLNAERETKAPVGQEPWRCALPVITVQMLADFMQEGFFEQTAEPVQGVGGVMWSQAAVDFACLIQGIKKERSAVEPPPERRETGWLVEDGAGHARPRFRTMDQTGIHWTDDANKALRFARRADAEMFAAGDEDAWRVTQHQWVTVDGDFIHAENGKGEQT